MSHPIEPLRSLDDLRARLRALPGPDEACRAAAAAREPTLTKPLRSLGRLEPLAHWIAGWQGRHPPTLNTPRAHVFAGNHGVALEGVSAYPPEVTVQMVANFRRGGAGINQLCKAFNIALEVTELDLDRPTQPFDKTAAMTEEEVVAALNAGLCEPLEGVDCLCLGEMGIGNTTSAAALSMALYGGVAEDWTGPGSGIAGSALETKIRVVRDGVALHAPMATDGLDLLRRLGGRELAAMAGGIVAARLSRVPVILDGFILCAAAACLKAVAPDALDHCVLGHVSREPGHQALVARMGLEPLLRMDMALGEASGAALAVPMLRAACFCHAGMATFAEAGVSDRV
ncbi:nicotinate-nucleotide--dimethylbenzimidazole phosphoribosyltransferase [Pararhodospirillum oryzae]|uniref:Nicotinate-nucleotide--dimethylbenzimidazole phosphoribosyltransferase n=1 Tax=Pararhodospirillum oryzae TaxID=478448 RepID=A0A512H716_9PROT|nr:nicotinate-nucleotide--dimethylbenzimidazole phosphoribosyltransferase [Pararhodospirillum oryzae]GEO81180.1 nicotinate-nucleotide--dimethylbenzimidazole phosphoribosyltransferase [Pararhodospirillum oryzae]